MKPADVKWLTRGDQAVLLSQATILIGGSSLAHLTLQNIQETCGELVALACVGFASPEPPDESTGLRIGPIGQSSRMTPQQTSSWRVRQRRISYAAAGATRLPLRVV
jgi:hypothetical protein